MQIDINEKIINDSDVRVIVISKLKNESTIFLNNMDVIFVDNDKIDFGHDNNVLRETKGFVELISKELDGFIYINTDNYDISNIKVGVFSYCEVNNTVDVNFEVDGRRYVADLTIEMFKRLEYVSEKQYAQKPNKTEPRVN